MKYGYVYILQSLKNGRYYIGSSKNVEVRLKEFHNKGKVKATRYLQPLILVFSKRYKNMMVARKIEWKLKSYKSRKILDKIISSQKCTITID